MEKHYWHICTDGLAREIIFKDVKDYIFGMNGVPTLSLSYGITVLAFCLMSNYVNIIIPKKLLYIAKNKYNMHLITLSRFSKELFFTLLFS